MALDKKYFPVGFSLIEKYSKSNSLLLESLSQQQRAEEGKNLRGISYLSWAHINGVLKNCEQLASRESERYFASLAIQWLNKKGIV